MDDDDNVRAPIPAVRMRLVDNNVNNNNNNVFGDETIEEFEERIMNDPNIDEDMQEIMIQSRREFLEKANQFNQANRINKSTKSSAVSELYDNDNFNNELIERAGKISGFVIHLKNFKNKPLRVKLENKLQDYMNSSTDIIKLDNEEYIEYDEFFNNIELDSDNRDYIKKIIIPKNPDAFEEYKKIIEKSKEDYLFLEKKNEEKKSRSDLSNIIYGYINKLSGIDKNIMELKYKLEEPINSYNNLRTNFIFLESNVYSDFIKFINSIRILPQDKITILNLIKSE